MNRLTRIQPALRLYNLGSIRAMASNPTRGDGSQIGDSSGSGGAGSVRSAGGKFAEREAAFENQYFHNLEVQQLKKLKEHISDEIKHHEEQIEHHKEAIERHKKKSKELEKAPKK